MKYIWILLFSLSLTNLSAQSTKTLPVRDFQSLEIGSSFKVNVTKGPFKVVAEGRAEDLSDVDYEVSNGELNISFKNKGNWGSWNNHKTVKLSIQMPALKATDFSGAVDANVAGFTSKTFSIDMSGATNATFNISVDQLHVDLSGASDLTLVGDADRVKASISGASDLKARAFKTDDAEVPASGASDATIWVNRSLSASASGASDIKCTGKGTITHKSSSGGSSVKKVD